MESKLSKRTGVLSARGTGSQAEQRQSMESLFFTAVR